MAYTLRVDTGNTVGYLQRVWLGLGREIDGAIRGASSELQSRTAAHTPYGPGPQGPGDPLPHIRETYYTLNERGAIAIGSTHPGAIVHEFGGTIKPRGTAIHIKRSAMALQAGTETVALIEQELDMRIERLIATS